MSPDWTIPEYGYSISVDPADKEPAMVEEPDRMTITEFLLARIAEDESVAPEWADEAWDSAYIEMFTARWLRECEAKRRIVEAIVIDNADEDWWVCAVLAAVYADHPDYQPEWAPEWAPTQPAQPRS